ncbi:uncharacterized protein LACBIDRAFT_333684 [Laccaria bicolor S238N-H82]|uniref:Predicted protein n=1 Tax=Laccaria bicolor (strain S238N-H82 / ATCC MYA-4686) TaxID=486041 RepID=B0DWL4_LACBS|nr:uncharacterized protein LACBIDRAFT_333684 [Laccaria bicolor S238N-H82]EDR01000.1 predicted protein [Laccaria bicolor S238N-H82]|eukprot:XP_001888395.1 predicted protein [Laccaria bicolor S238N-H82]
MRQLATGPTPNWGNCNRKKDRTTVWFSLVHLFFVVLWTEPLNTMGAECFLWALGCCSVGSGCCFSWVVGGVFHGWWVFFMCAGLLFMGVCWIVVGAGHCWLTVAVVDGGGACGWWCHIIVIVLLIATSLAATWHLDYDKLPRRLDLAHTQFVGDPVVVAGQHQSVAWSCPVGVTNMVGGDAMGEDTDHIQLSFYMLQIRCKGAVNHIHQDLNSIQAIFGQFNNALTNRSYNSTLSDIWSNYGQLPPHLEVARHMLREDYQREMPEHLQSYKDKLVEEWVKSGREINACPYERKPAHYPQLKYNEQFDSPRAWSRMQGSLPIMAPSQPLVFGSVFSRDQRCAPPPTSISMAVSRNHPLSHFAGLNSNMGDEEGREGEDSDPHNPWITVQSGHSHSTHSRPTHVNKNTCFASPHEDHPSTLAIRMMDSFSYMRQGRSGRSLNGGGPPDRDSPPGEGLLSGPRYPAQQNNEGLPPFQGHAQNSGQGPPRGEPPGGDPSYSINPEEKGPEDKKNKGEWQLNNKISMGMILQWDGNPTTMIDYIMEIALLAQLSKRLFKEIGQIAPIRWTGSVKGWWMTLPRADQAYFSQDWECLMTGMHDHFMNDEWLNNRGIKFNAM